MTETSQKKIWFELNPIKTLVIFFIFCILLFEGVLRVFFPDLTKFDDQLIISSELVFKDTIPNTSFIRKPSDKDAFKPALNIINSIGVRGPEIGPKIHYRVLNIGDSFIQADEVEFSDTFGEKLNQVFENKIEFISHGLASYSPTPEFSWVYHKGLPLGIDEVNLFLCVNDFFRLEVYGGTDANYRSAAIYQGKIPVKYLPMFIKKDGVIKHFLKDVNLVRLVYLSYIKFKAQFAKVEIPTQDKPFVDEISSFGFEKKNWPTALQTEVEKTLVVIKDMKEFLASKNIKLNLLLVPIGFRYKDESIYGKQDPTYGWSADHTITQDGLEKEIIKLAQEINVPYINLTEKFDSVKKAEKILLFNKMDGHWNKNGHEIVFQTLKDFYSDRSRTIK